MLCHCGILLEQHALPSDWTSSSPKLQLHQLPGSCSVLIGGRPSFLALKQPHLPHPAEGPDHAQKNPDKEHFYSLTILQASSQRVALFPRTFYPLAFSVASNTIPPFSRLPLHNATLLHCRTFLVFLDLVSVLALPSIINSAWIGLLPPNRLENFS